MNQAHQHYLGDIHFFIGILTKQISHDSHMPGVFRIIFIPPVPGKMRLPENVLFFINFKSKCQLLFQSLIHKQDSSAISDLLTDYNIHPIIRKAGIWLRFFFRSLTGLRIINKKLS